MSALDLFSFSLYSIFSKILPLKNVESDLGMNGMFMNFMSLKAKYKQIVQRTLK